jgi:uncharacterized protein YndB with AHSA1/START domain
MTGQSNETSVRRSIVVEAPVQHTFSVFTEDIGSWWDPGHHLIADTFDHMVFEPRVGGHIIDVAVDGSECRWSRVLAYEPPSRIVFSWDINLQWQLESDPARTSEIEVRFTALDAGRTQVDLEHRHIDRHGSGWEAMRDAVGSPNGWNLEHFAAVAGGAAARAARATPAGTA